MGEDRQGRRAAEPGVEPLVDRRDDVGDSPVAGCQPCADRRLALAAVPGQSPEEPGGLAHRAAMPRPVDRLVAAAQLVEGLHVGPHRAVRRGHDRRRPRHDVVAREQRPRLRQREGEMVHRVTGGLDGHEGPARAGHGVALHHDPFRRVRPVGARVEHRGLRFRQGPRGPVRRASDDRRAGARGEQPCSGRVIPMGVGDHDGLDPLGAEILKQRVDMGRIVRARIDHRDALLAHHVGAGAARRERAAVRRDPSADQRRDPVQPAGRRHRGIEGQGGLVGVRHRDPVRSKRRFHGRSAAAWQSPRRLCGSAATAKGVSVAVRTRPRCWPSRPGWRSHRAPSRMDAEGAASDPAGRARRAVSPAGAAGARARGPVRAPVPARVRARPRAGHRRPCRRSRSRAPPSRRPSIERHSWQIAASQIPDRAWRPIFER